MNVCSYHLQEAGATPVQELAFALATAIAVLDAVKASGEVSEAEFPQIVGRISFFVNAGIRFVTEMCKMRAFAELWDEICRERYGCRRREAAPLPLWRAGEFAGPHRAAAGEQCLPHPARDAGRGAVEERPRPRRATAGLERGAGPAAALGPAMVAAHAADRRLSKRTFSTMATSSTARRRSRPRSRRCNSEAREELKRVINLGGATRRKPYEYMKRALVESNAARLQAIEAGETKIVGVNAFTTTEPSPLSADDGEVPS